MKKLCSIKMIGILTMLLIISFPTTLEAQFFKDKIFRKSQGETQSSAPIPEEDDADLEYRDENEEEFVDFFDYFPEDRFDVCDGHQLLKFNSFNKHPQSNWNIHNLGYVVFEEHREGCRDDGYVKMTADPYSHSAISQATIMPIEREKYYQMAFCFRTTGNYNNNLRIKAFAFNGSPGNFDLSSDLAIIDLSAYLPATNGEWVNFKFPAWESNDDFNNIAIMVECDHASPWGGYELDIDNICFAEVEEIHKIREHEFSYVDCDSLLYPTQLRDLIDIYGIQVTETETRVEMGTTQDLYAHKFDLSTDLWYNDNQPFNNNVGGGLNLEDCYDQYKQIDSLGVMDNHELDSLSFEIDSFALYVSNAPFSSNIRGGFDPITPLTSPTNNCLYFDGVDDNVTIKNQIFYGINSNDFTIEMTINLDPSQNYTNAVLMSNSKVHTSAGGYGGATLISGSGFRLLLHQSNTTGIYQIALQQEGLGTNAISNGLMYYIPNNGVAGNLIDNDCHQIAVARSGDDLLFYIDGVLIGQKYIDPFQLPSLNMHSSAKVQIGKDTDTQNAFKGTIYDVRVWNIARSSTDIASTTRTQRFSYNANGLITNFELQNIPDQEFYNTAFNSVSATLGSNSSVSSDDPSAGPLSRCCDAFDPACTGGIFVEDITKPFGGRSIVYVHGLQLDHVFRPFDPVPKFTGSWPTESEDFYIGEYKTHAIDKWEDHINRQLGSISNPSNNYLIAPYSCNQRLPYGVHSITQQIKDAIETGRGVVWANSGHSDCRPIFGEEIVIISHSTGGLVTSTLLGLGEMSAVSGSPVQTEYGDFQAITDRIKAHVAFSPAVSGSPLARATLVISAIIGPGFVKNIIAELLSTMAPGNPGSALLALKPSWMYQTILVDLEPIVAHNVWGINTYHEAKCQTVTAASAYPGMPQGSRFLEALAAKNVIPGLDDGVLSIDCQCGRKKNFPYTIPSQFVIRPNLTYKNFDMGNPLMYKSLGMYLETKSLRMPLLAGGACVNGKTPTGMLTWKLDDTGPPPRWDNHYSLIQGTGYHYEGWDVNPNGMDYYKCAPSWIPVYEESKVITDSDIYDIVPGTNTPLVHPSIKGSEEEIVKKKTIGFNFLGKYYEIIIWKRTYHLMKNYQNNDEASYMYKYVLKP